MSNKKLNKVRMKKSRMNQKVLKQLLILQLLKEGLELRIRKALRTSCREQNLSTKISNLRLQMITKETQIMTNNSLKH